MFNGFEPVHLLLIFGDLAIWYGLYYLCARAFIRNVEESGRKPVLLWFSLAFLAIFLIVHLFWIYMGIELYRWGGPD